MKQYIWFLFTLLILMNPAYAKWASINDAPIKTSCNQETIVNADGTKKEVTTIQMEILKEPGRNILSHYNLLYNGDSEKIQILEAKTIYKNKEYKLEKKLIEDKPLASSPYGFDQLRQILLAFPKLEIGAKIYLKFQLNTTKVPLDKFYSHLFCFGDQGYVTDANVKLHSQIPLHVLINDPDKVLNVTKDQIDNCHNIEIKLVKPIYKEIISEPEFSIVNKKDLTWVSISSLSNWNDLAIKFSQMYTKILTQPLPEDFVKIAMSASKKMTEIDQINAVTSLLNEKIQYMGDWRSIQGKCIPRDLKKITQTQLGDCKDFAAATAVILNKLGYKTQIALVRRGIFDYYPLSLPDSTAFNHALVKVTNKQGKIYWIDPTNFQSMADGIFPDIANKNALVLDLTAPSYEKIPSIAPNHAQGILTRQIEIFNDNKTIEQGNFTLKNEEAYSITGALLQTSEDTIKDLIFYQLSGTRLDTQNKISLQLPDLNSRIVRNLSFNYSFSQNNRVLKTNLGQALKLTYNKIHLFLDTSQDCVGDLLLDFSSTDQRRTIVKNVMPQNITSLNKEIISPWLYIARKCSSTNNNLQIDDIMVIYKNLITSEDRKKPEFIKLKDELEKNFRDVAIVLTPKP